MADKFNAGDVVRLKSGGPRMTVVEYGNYGGRKAVCRWFDEKGTIQTYSFADTELESDEGPAMA